MMHISNDKKKMLILAMAALSIVYGLFLLAFVGWKLLTKKIEWIESDLIFIIPQFIYGLLFLIGGVGTGLIKNKFRILLLLTVASKLLFVLIFMGTFTRIYAHVTYMIGTYPLALTHDLVSTALSLALLIGLVNRNIIEVFINKNVDLKDEARYKIKYYTMLGALLLVIGVAVAFSSKSVSFGLVNSMSLWCFVFITWRLVMNVLSIKRGRDNRRSNVEDSICDSCDNKKEIKT